MSTKQLMGSTGMYSGAFEHLKTTTGPVLASTGVDPDTTEQHKTTSRRRQHHHLGRLGSILVHLGTSRLPQDYTRSLRDHYRTTGDLDRSAARIWKGLGGLEGGRNMNHHHDMAEWLHEFQNIVLPISVWWACFKLLTGFVDPSCLGLET